MKNPLFFLYATAFILFAAVPNLMAQSVTGGQITYEKMIDYQLEGAYDDPRWESYIAGLPTSGKSVHLLSFTTEHALYEEDLSKKEVLSDHLQTVLMKVNYSKTPKPEVKQILYDLKQRERTEQVTFMTRSFQVESGLEPLPWKLTNKRKKVLDYVCMGADLEVGEKTITAWFTPQIPISIGPGSYYGLPGVILGLEREEEVFLLATAIDLKVPEESLPAKLNNGRKLSSEEFDQIVEEKTAEFKQSQAAKKKAAGKSKN